MLTFKLALLGLANCWSLFFFIIIFFNMTVTSSDLVYPQLRYLRCLWWEQWQWTQWRSVEQSLWGTGPCSDAHNGTAVEEAGAQQSEGFLNNADEREVESTGIHLFACSYTFRPATTQWQITQESEKIITVKQLASKLWNRILGRFVYKCALTLIQLVVTSLILNFKEPQFM